MAQDPEDSELMRLRSKRGLWIVAALVLLALFLIRPGAGRLRLRIVSSISAALGRPVDVSKVSLRLLPRPGFDLQGFVVGEDPAFGAEPMLHADEVTATLRLSSLLRGRLEIARLSLTEPSLNLVENSSGHWNLENLLQRVDNTRVAPTGKGKIEARPGFPYIEADHARINFKLGQEKKPYALTNADFSLWQDSENTWGMRLKADPMRTDFNLSDTGGIRMEGSWQRSASLRDTPLQFTLQWERAQLGQVSKLAYGRDQGWRGGVGILLAVKGTPAQLNVDADVSVDDFRRYDLADGLALPLRTHCSGLYSSVSGSLQSLSCQAPVGGGFIDVQGNISGWHEFRAYDLALVTQAVPAQSLVALARRVKKGIPADLTATGMLDASFRFQRSEGSAAKMLWSGNGAIRGLRLRSKSARADLALDRIPFSVASGRLANSGRSADAVSATSATSQFLPRFEIGPFGVLLGRPTPAVVRGEASGSGYSIGIQGEAQIQRVLQLARVLGLPSPQSTAEGIARMEFQVSGPWSAFVAPQTTGKAQLRSVRAEVRGLAQPLEIATANVVLSPDQAEVKNIAASLAGSTWHGAMTLPRQCVAPDGCPIHFDLHTDSVATDDFSALFNGRSRGQPWYRFLSSAPQPSVPLLRGLLASGKLSAGRVTIHKLVASRVSANVTLEDGNLRLSDLRADVLGGRHDGEWTADFTSKPPSYSGNGTFARISLAQLADAMHDGWITGSAEGSYHAAATGWTMAELLSTADASLETTALDGALPHITLTAADGPLQLRRFEGKWRLRNGRLEIQQGKLDTPTGIFEVSGTASLGRILDLKLTSNGVPRFDVTGSLNEPHVAQSTAAETQAALKP